ncbi:MAG: sensor histidine kinase [Thermaerobacter sp.]|nr:sensor histidine kinase [Thermaerobacter sp.]
MAQHSPEGMAAFDGTDHTIQMMEEERRRIARDLHDGPIQTLVNASMRLDVLGRLLYADLELAEEEIQRVNRRVVRAINEMRQLIFDLQPVAIDEMGLSASLEALSGRMEKEYGFSCRTEVAREVDSLALTPARKIWIYRLAQEALSNVGKHAEAHHVQMILTAAADGAILQVMDDGKGFDPSVPIPGHYGLTGIAERVALLGGALTVASRPDEGTAITVRIPADGHV